MERRYVAVRTVGNPMQIFERVRRVVQDMGVTRTVPAVKFERRARREFYVFLAVDGDRVTYLPDDVITVLDRAGLAGQHFWPLESAEIGRMTGGNELETHSFNALPYTSSWPSESGDPFDLSDVSFNTENTDDTLLGENFDQLVYWLSANAEGTWQTFARVCSILQLVDDVKAARLIFRRLKLLGYIESSEDGRRWSICPTTLVQCAADQDLYILTGQQTPMLIEQLMEHYAVELLPQPNYQGPSCVRVNGIFTDDVALNGFNIVHAGTVSVQLAQLLPGLEGWKDILSAINKLSTTTYNIEIWNGRRYIQCDNFSERDGEYCGDSGLYRLTKEKKIILIKLSFILMNQINDGCVETGMACVSSHTTVPDANLK